MSLVENSIDDLKKKKTEGNCSRKSFFFSWQLYKNVFSPALGPSLAFIGFVQPASGGVLTMSETQARWFGQICRGRVQLPQKHLMEMDMEMEMVRNLPELAQHCCGDGLVYAYLLCAPLSVCVCV